MRKRGFTCRCRRSTGRHEYTTPYTLDPKTHRAIGHVSYYHYHPRGLGRVLVRLSIGKVNVIPMVNALMGRDKIAELAHVNNSFVLFITVVSS